jgi:hypothetical protein
MRDYKGNTGLFRQKRSRGAKTVRVRCLNRAVRSWRQQSVRPCSSPKVGEFGVAAWRNRSLCHWTNRDTRGEKFQLHNLYLASRLSQKGARVQWLSTEDCYKHDNTVAQDKDVTIRLLKFCAMPKPSLYSS